MRGRSDHAPLLVKCGSTQSRGKGFRFLNAWCSHPDFLKVVKEAWEMLVEAQGMETFFRKLMRTKAKLREWSLGSFGNIFHQVQATEQALKQCEMEYDRDRNSQTKIRLEEAKAGHSRDLAVEYDYWRQKLGIK